MTEWSQATGADGQTFVFREAGSGPVVLLFHGFPDTPHGWEEIAQAVAATGRRVVWPWLRGYHPATLVPGRGYDAVTLGRDAIALLDALGVDKATIVGHDWGALVTYGAASLHPERVEAIVPVAIPHPSLLPRTPQSLWAARHFFSLRMPWAERMVARNGFSYINMIYHRWAPSWRGADRDACIANVKECFREPSSLTGALDYYRAIKPRPDPQVARPPAVRALIVGGTADLAPAELFTKTAEVMDGRALILDGTGHWPHRERQDEFIAGLLDFLG
jgi:pimeloyl-ACP methyl ester carboxylesterase